MDFKDYPTKDNDVNEYTKIIIFNLPNLYSSAQNYIYDSEILFFRILKRYFDCLEEIVKSKSKFTNELKAKQFKKDMLNLKKSMINYKGINTDWVKNVTDSLCKILVPENLIQKKK